MKKKHFRLILIIIIALVAMQLCSSCEKPECYDVGVTLLTKVYSNDKLYSVIPHCYYTETHCNMTHSQLKKWCKWSSEDSVKIDNYTVSGCLLDSIVAYEYRYYEIVY